MPSAQQKLQPSKRPAGGQSRVPLNLPSKRGSKRSRRVAKKLANTDPPSPPLKLPKLYVTLSRKEVQEDWFKITGQKYSGKPRKSTLVQLGLGLGTSLACPSTIRYLNDPQQRPRRGSLQHARTPPVIQHSVFVFSMPCGSASLGNLYQECLSRLQLQFCSKKHGRQSSINMQIIGKVLCN